MVDVMCIYQTHAVETVAENPDKIFFVATVVFVAHDVSKAFT